MRVKGLGVVHLVVVVCVSEGTGCCIFKGGVCV